MAGDKLTTTINDLQRRKDLALVDTLLKKHEGGTLDELGMRAFKRGMQVGHKRGHTDGYRAAKGRKKSSRLKAKDVIASVVSKIGWHSRPSDVAKAAIEILEAYNCGQAFCGHPIPADVARFLKTRRRSPWPASWPREATLLSAYYRERANR